MSTELKELLVDMQKRANGHLLFSSPFNNEVPVNDSAIRRRIKSACTALGIRPVTPHGLRSFFVTQCREGGLSDAEIAALIGDKSGAPIISQTYGDVRPDFLFKKLSQVKFRDRNGVTTTDASTVPNCIPPSYDSSEGFNECHTVSDS